MNKDLLIEYCFNGHKSPISIRMRWHNIKCHDDVYQFLINYFKDADDTNSSASEILYRIINNINEVPKCPICGKRCKFLRYDRGYSEFCSNECKNSNMGRQIIESHILKTFLENYGCICPLKNEEIKNKLKATNLEKYGGNSPACNKEVIEKMIKTSKEKYGEHYEKVVEKQRATNIKHFGYEYNVQRPEILEASHSNESNIKKYNTRKLNNSFNSSKIEELFKEYLELNFTGDYIHLYRSQLYPFNCDFYIKSLDLYIEIQGSWTHGRHPYNEQNDKEILNEWAQKDSKYYSNAINTWTIKDPYKRKIAKENNLKYLEIFTNNINDAIKSLKDEINNIIN